MPNLRPASDADVPTIIAIVHSAFWSNFGRLETTASQNDGYRKSVRERHQREAQDYWQDIVIAELDGEPCGWGARFPSKNEIAEMWVHADFQGRGVGALLLRRFLDDIAGEGHSEAWIETHKRNIGAIRLYQRMGFAIDHDRSHFSTGLGRDIPIVRMRQQLR